MKIGYPCINWTLKATPKTFRLASYSDERMRESVLWNLDALAKVLAWNAEKGFRFFRISSDLVPFASHPVCTFDWRKHFSGKFKEIGDFVKKHKMRISMHPDQFVLINALKADVVERSARELEYHCDVLDLMGLDESAKVQIHIGGVYGNKAQAIARFIENYRKLPEKITRRLAIENDDRLFSLRDCLEVNRHTGIPIIFDVFHHECLSEGESLRGALELASKTWKKKDGILMVDYSSQKMGARVGTHTQEIDLAHFKRFLKESDGFDFDVMLEIKDKETSAAKALSVIS